MDTLGQRFALYASQVMGLPVSWGRAVATRLPAYLAHRYEPYHIDVDGHAWYAIVLKDDEPLTPTLLRKQVEQLLDLIDAGAEEYCLVTEQLPPYLRQRLAELRMPFVIPGRQLYWPALGNAATRQRERRTPVASVERITPAAQQLLIAMMLARLPRPMTVTESAKILQYSAMAISRAVKDLEGAGLIVSTQHGRQRVFTPRGKSDEVWAKALPMLQSPVIDTVRVMSDDLPKAFVVAAGETALAQRSELVAPQEPVYAIASRKWNRELSKMRVIPTRDEGTCRIELWRYAPEPTAEQGAADALSVYLSLRDHADERVQQALETMMEHVPW